jgi:hypothetical protein
MVFSVLETCAMFYLMFRMFKIDLMFKEMLFASIIMAFVSYTLRAVYEIPVLDVPLQLILMLAFVWMLFRVHLFYATIMTGMVYQAYFLIQTVFYYLLNILGEFNNSLPVVTNISTYLLQFISVISACLIGLFVSRKRKGFDFVPDKPKGRLFLKKKDWVLLALSIPSFSVVSFTIFLVEQFNEIFFVVDGFYAVILYSYLFMSYKRDRSDL